PGPAGQYWSVRRGHFRTPARTTPGPRHLLPKRFAEAAVAAAPSFRRQTVRGRERIVHFVSLVEVLRAGSTLPRRSAIPTKLPRAHRVLSATKRQQSRLRRAFAPTSDVPQTLRGYPPTAGALLGHFDPTIPTLLP